MGWFSKPKVNTVTTTEAEKEKETAKNKARLLGTEGKNNGAELNAEQGRNVRRIFG